MFVHEAKHAAGFGELQAYTAQIQFLAQLQVAVGLSNEEIAMIEKSLIFPMFAWTEDGNLKIPIEPDPQGINAFLADPTHGYTNTKRRAGKTYPKHDGDRDGLPFHYKLVDGEIVSTK